MQKHLVKLPTNQLQTGMFVVELDRPWLATPFLLQGVLAESETDLQTLRRRCKFVFVDPRRSTAPIPGAPLLTLEGSVPVRGGDAGLNLPPNKILAPPGVRLMRYPKRVPLSRELPRARQVYRRAAHTVAGLFHDIEGIGGLRISAIENVVPELVESVIANPDALMWMTQMRATDDELYGHGLRSGIYMLILGRHLGFPPAELKRIAMIGLLLDIGKIQLPPALLAKKGKFTEPELIVVRKHVQFGLDMLADAADLPEAVYVGIAHHHERIDGTGYPFALRDDEISIYGRM